VCSCALNKFCVTRTYKEEDFVVPALVGCMLREQFRRAADVGVEADENFELADETSYGWVWEADGVFAVPSFTIPEVEKITAVV
jgi:hypothetical protein